jgi:hypothetical protein
MRIASALVIDELEGSNGAELAGEPEGCVGELGLGNLARAVNVAVEDSS